MVVAGAGGGLEKISIAATEGDEEWKICGLIELNFLDEYGSLIAQGQAIRLLILQIADELQHLDHYFASLPFGHLSLGLSSEVQTVSLIALYQV